MWRQDLSRLLLDIRVVPNEIVMYQLVMLRLFGLYLVEDMGS